MSRTTKYTDMGWPEQDALWAYDSLSEPLLSSELHRLAGARSYDNTDCVTFQPCPNRDESNQDRYAIFDWTLGNGTWQCRFLLDGHAGHDTVEYVLKTLPSIIQNDLTILISKEGTEPNVEVISRVLTDAISSLDNDLTNDVLKLFPNVDVISSLSDEDIQVIINDQSSGGKNSSVVMRCMRGTTVLVSLVDPMRQNIWVASLGDCQAALGIRQHDGRWQTSLLSSYHNGANPGERRRIMQEHPGEAECVMEDRVLGAIAVTRAVGDHLFKLPTTYTKRIFLNAKPGFLLTRKIDDFLGRNKTPPYISNRADVQHAKLRENESYLIMCSDGLLDLYEDEGLSLDALADLWVQLLARREKSWDDSNLALYLLRHALGGDDEEMVSRMITVEMPFRWMDDTTIVVQKL
ncbi:protein serine threonine phosphatase 2C [Lyophyllum atratum]|nr:protein serine threonine phosphatase 2C [Lyophyllum atratum]